jgi:hypothetical protein
MGVTGAGAAAWRTDTGTDAAATMTDAINRELARTGVRITGFLRLARTMAAKWYRGAPLVVQPLTFVVQLPGVVQLVATGGHWPLTTDRH